MKIHNINFRLRDVYLSVLEYLNNIPISDSRIIFSSPRGGSTWLAELLNLIPGSVVFWEPLHISNVGVFNKVLKEYNAYLPLGDQNEAARRAFSKLFKGKLLNNWICSMNSARNFYRPKYPIFKFCYANALAPWLLENFSFTFKPVYLLRHPFSVALSQMNHPSWGGEFAEFPFLWYKENLLVHENSDFLRTINTKEAVLTAIWCITNKPSISCFSKNNKVHFLYYEHLVQDPKTELLKITEIWEMNYIEEMEGYFRKSSISNVTNSDVSDVNGQLEKWKRIISPDVLRKMIEVLNHFEVDAIYDETSLYPKVINA